MDDETGTPDDDRRVERMEDLAESILGFLNRSELEGIEESDVDQVQRMILASLRSIEERPCASKGDGDRYGSRQEEDAS